MEDFYKDSTKKDSCSVFCKICTKIRQKAYNRKNVEKIAVWNRQYHQDNSSKLIEYTKKYKESNKEAIAEYQQNYQKNNREKIQQQNKEYHKKYYAKNKSVVLSKNNKRDKVRYKVDPCFALRKNMASRMNEVFKLKGAKKQYKTEQLLGCSFQEYKDYLESKFESWMTWDNRGLYNGETNYGWDVDHIKPLSSAETTEELIKLCHYTNLQPLCSYDNRCIKKDKK